MKIKLLTLALLIVSSPAMANVSVPNFSGTHEKLESETILQVQSQIVVFAGTETGRNEIVELRADDYLCDSRYRQFWMCRKFLKLNDVTIPDSMRERAHRQLEEERYLAFGQRRGAASLIHGDANGVYAEWRVPQEAVVGGLRYSEFRYARTVSSSGMVYERVKFGEAGSPNSVEFLLRPTGEFQRVVSIKSDRHELFVMYLIPYMIAQ